MQRRLKGLERVALVYSAVKHAQGLALEQAVGSLREVESAIARQRDQTARLSAEGRASLDAGDSLEWQMNESQKQFTEWNAEALLELKERRQAQVVAATETYRAGRMQLEQMESVLRELRSKRELERVHNAQRESDDRFLSRQWWDDPGGSAGGAVRHFRDLVEDAAHQAGDEDGRMKGG